MVVYGYVWDTDALKCSSMVRDDDPIRTNENIRDCIETLGVCLDS